MGCSKWVWPGCSLGLVHGMASVSVLSVGVVNLAGCSWGLVWPGSYFHYW